MATSVISRFVNHLNLMATILKTEPNSKKEYIAFFQNLQKFKEDIIYSVLFHDHNQTTLSYCPPVQMWEFSF